MKKLGLSIAVLLMLVLGLSYAPASLLKHALPHTLPQLQLAQLSGTVWHGRAEQAGWQFGGAVLPLGQLSWSLQWRSLLAFEPVLSLTAEAGTHRFEGQLRTAADGFWLRQARGRFPLQLFEAWLPMLVSAEVDIELKQMIYRLGQLVALDGVLRAEQVSWEVGDYRMPLGSYVAEARMQQQRVVLAIDDREALLGASAELRLDQQGGYQLQGVLTPRPQLAPEVARTIGWLGRRTATGAVLIDRQGFWR